MLSCKDIDSGFSCRKCKKTYYFIHYPRGNLFTVMKKHLSLCLGKTGLIKRRDYFILANIWFAAFLFSFDNLLNSNPMARFWVLPDPPFLTLLTLGLTIIYVIFSGIDDEIEHEVKVK